MDRSDETDRGALADPGEDAHPADDAAPEPVAELPPDHAFASPAAFHEEERGYIAAVRAMASRLEAPGVAVAVFKACWGDPLEGQTRLELRLFNRKHHGASTVVVTGNDLEAIEQTAQAALDDLASGRGDDVIVYQIGVAGTRGRVWRRA